MPEKPVRKFCIEDGDLVIQKPAGPVMEKIKPLSPERAKRFTEMPGPLIFVKPASEVAPAKRPRDSYARRGELKAPRDHYRLIGVDTFEAPDADFLVGDFESKDEAIAEASARAGNMCPMYVYSDSGELIFSAGKP